MPPFFRLLALCTCMLAGPEQAVAGTFNVIFENDLFYRMDRDYSNGLELSWSPDAETSPAILFRLAAELPWFSDDGTIRTSLGIGQLMFTPEHTRLTDPIATERPYAGFLYASASIRQERGSRQDQWRFQLGMTGPASLAADSQKFIHAIRNIDMPKGWHTQLRDEPGFVASYERSHTLRPFASVEDTLDFTPHAGFVVGNVYDYVDAGAVLRIGFNMPKDGSPPVIQPSPSGSSYYLGQSVLGAYMFAGIEGRLVGRNLFLDGNSFQASRSVAKENLVGDFMFGGTVALDRFQFSYVHMFRSPEYAGQRGFDQFGRMSLAVAI
jgi:hypothetical protein